MNRVLLILFLAVVATVGYFWPPQYRIETVPAPEIKLEDLTSLEGISSQDVWRKAPNAEAGSVEITEMRNSRYFDYMAMNSLISLHSALQERENPVALEIKSGVYRLEDLRDEENIIHEGGIWKIRVPIIIHPQATLIIETGEETVFLENSSFLSSFGKLFVLDSTLRAAPNSSWHKKKFRPFVVVWSEGEGYFADSHFYDLGYSHAKSYGVTFSSSAIMEREEGEKIAPKGLLINNHFEGLYYGFYSYEAEDIVVAHNVYKDNLVYGIDPHDYSRNLIIAYNQVSGTKEKHGIILSRSVDNSIIYKNKSYDNEGSGIMLERNCTRNVIVENVMNGNKGDGLVFLESSGNLSQKNKMMLNGKSGIRIRNSHNLSFYKDEASGNKDYGLMAYSRALVEQKDRDMMKDSYSRTVNFSIVEGKLLDNKKAALSVKDARQVQISQALMLKSPKIVAGDLEPYATDILDGNSITLTREKSYADFLLMR